MKKVYITGMGCISCAGKNTQETLLNLFREPSLPGLPPPHSSSSLKTPVYSLPAPFCNLHTLLTEAVSQALHDAGPFPLSETGICIGTTGGCQFHDSATFSRMRSGEPADRKILEDFFNGSPAEFLRTKLGTSGPAVTVSNACASGADALVLGALWIASGRCQRTIVCGGDILNQVSISGFHSLGVTSMEPCRPFDKHRSGLNLGEGAGAVVLESEDSMRERGKKSELILSGFASSGDAYHITAPSPQGAGLERAIQTALKMSGLQPSDIGLINAHGTGTTANDPAEAAALCRIFGKDVKYHSTKTHTGHTLGAAGTLEFIFAALMLRSGHGAPAFRFHESADEIPYPPVSAPFEIRTDAVLSTSLAFGGCNTALIIRKTGRC